MVRRTAGRLTFIILLHLWRNVPFYGVAFLAAMQPFLRTTRRPSRRGKRHAALFAITLRHPQHDVVRSPSTLWTFNNFDLCIFHRRQAVSRTDVLPVYVTASWTSYTVGYAASMGVTADHA